jgi:hypothetical protein
MADKLVPGDSLNEEVFNKFNGMADEVNALKESGGGSGGGSVELTKEAITDALGYTPSKEVRVTPKYTNGRNLAFIGIGNTGYNIYSPDAECITDVVELPDPDREHLIDASKIYRVTKVQSLVGGVKNQMPNPSTWLPDMLSGVPINIRHVETLPTTAVEPAYDNLDKPTRFVFYYLVTGEKLTDWSTDERIYAFLPAGTHLNTSTTYDVDTWVPVSAFLAHYMITDKGVITSEAEATSSSHSSMYFLADIELYHYRNGWQKVSKGVTEKRVSEMIAEGSTKAIIDTQGLPTQNINDKSFYRNKGGIYMYIEGGTIIENGVPTANGIKVNFIECDALPEAGLPSSLSTIYCYLVKNGDKVVPWVYYEGWIEQEASVYYSKNEIPSDAGNSILYCGEDGIYHYKDGWHKIDDGRGGSSGGGNKTVVSVSLANAVFEPIDDSLTDFVCEFREGDDISTNFIVLTNAIIPNLGTISSVSATLGGNIGVILAFSSPLKLYALNIGGDGEIYLNGEFIAGGDSYGVSSTEVTFGLSANGDGFMAIKKTDAETVDMMSMLTLTFTINY